MHPIVCSYLVLGSPNPGMPVCSVNCHAVSEADVYNIFIVSRFIFWNNMDLLPVALYC